MRYPVPNRRGEVSAGTGPVVTYMLSDVELAYLHGGELDKIPTADRRGKRGSRIPLSVRESKTIYRIRGEG
ncbi:hypothetical protein [Cohnella sp. REN36]|uniref:hypothetical protein n=1 Tax=Cohnella sp. REN36 TaxID=2887347 RepID=UPI001D14D7EB|nr:hypothetical protein [Cohnella sp. REN36]MCC3375494.1 hypothetical protein [Cohnella sp. REN36]